MNMRSAARLAEQIVAATRINVTDETLRGPEMHGLHSDAARVRLMAGGVIVARRHHRIFVLQPDAERERPEVIERHGAPFCKRLANGVQQTADDALSLAFAKGAVTFMSCLFRSGH